MTPEERVPTLPQELSLEERASINSREGPGSGGDSECPICLDPLDSGTLCTLPCTHIFHASCVEGLRSFGIKQVCPICRADLPGPEQPFEASLQRYFKLRQQIESGKATWNSLTEAQKSEMRNMSKMWTSAAKQGQGGAPRNLDATFLEGHDHAGAAYEEGDAQAQFNLGIKYYNGQGVKKDHAEAVSWYRKAAEQGHAQAQSNLGYLFDNGEGVEQSDVEAARWYRKAADQGYADAQFNLGLMFRNGQGVKQSDSEAARWYRKAAKQGCSHAQLNLGLMIKNGQGVKQNHTEAANWYRKAAEQEHAKAQCNLGVTYDKGKGVKQSDVEAARWYRKAAEQGNVKAQLNLGLMFKNGQGVKQNHKEATWWFR